MTPTSFEFTLTMPAEARLMGVIRGLVAQAAGYVKLSNAAGAAFANEVERAAQTSMNGMKSRATPLELTFSADEEAITVRISSEVGPTTKLPPSSAADGVSVKWSVNGSRQICLVRQPIST